MANSARHYQQRQQQAQSNIHVGISHDRSHRSVPMMPAPPHHLADDDYHDEMISYGEVSESKHRSKSRRSGRGKRSQGTMHHNNNHQASRDNHQYSNNRGHHNHNNHGTSYYNNNRNGSVLSLSTMASLPSVSSHRPAYAAPYVSMVSPPAGASMGGGIIGASGNRIPPVSTWSIEDWPVGQRVYRKAGNNIRTLRFFDRFGCRLIHWLIWLVLILI